MQPEVSIVTPMYNAELLVEETAASVLKQTYTNFEWLIVDDCSTDSSALIVRKIAEQDPRISLYCLEENKGPMYARNYAFKRATGRYIALIDSDDIWMPDKLEKQLNFMLMKNAALTYTAYRKILLDGSYKSGKIIPVPEQIPYRTLIHTNDIITSSVVYDTKKTGRVYQQDSVPIGKDDLHFFLSILKVHKQALGINEALVQFRVHNNSITSNKLQNAKVHWRFLRYHMGCSFFSACEKYVIYAIKGLWRYLQ
jgi:teichuronic acid biosynthesis glycosyltransferase TuaG